jgi:hypothetical protein
MTGEACANALPAKDALMSTDMMTGTRDDLWFMELLLDLRSRDYVERCALAQR